MSKAFIVLCLSLAALLPSGCNRGTLQRRLINEPGVSKSPDGVYLVIVQLSPDKTVHYTVMDAASKTEVFSGNAGSHRQRWYFVWDKQDNFWVHSSDIGGCVWMRQQGGFVQHRFEPGKPLPAEMPQEFREQLPESVKRQNP